MHEEGGRDGDGKTAALEEKSMSEKKIREMGTCEYAPWRRPLEGGVCSERPSPMTRKAEAGVGPWKERRGRSGQ